MGIQRLIVDLRRVQKTLRRRSNLGDLGPAQWPNTTARMMRPGTSVNRPATTSAPVKMAIMALRCRSTRWRRACTTASGSVASVKIESRWIGLHRPQTRRSWIQNELAATGAQPRASRWCDGAACLWARRAGPRRAPRRSTPQQHAAGWRERRSTAAQATRPLSAHLTPRLRDCLNWAARAAAESGMRPSKGNLVVHIAALAGTGQRRLLLTR
jgi:hypothetical protein